ncbi:hypothetical protein [Mycoplasma sp. P36-A1]|uniref:hypothetical protein n=1 Tax=Mycoplasma sp. P36-A1 TaxID=3252900 RepID=UPI003C3077A4
MSSYSENLLKTVIDNSEANNWDSAVLEWDILDCEEDDFNKSSCVCGKENIKYLYSIINTLNNNVIFPIGSTCITKFEREDLNEKTSINEKMFQLLHSIEDGKFISLTSEFFSRKLLTHFYEEGVFQANQYNDFNPEKDYNFMMKMFNKRSEPTVKQARKVRGIIVAAIKPYLEELLEGKIKRQ